VANGIKVELDTITANQVTLANLKDYRRYLKMELKRWRDNPKTENNPNGYWLHPDDVIGNKRRIKLLDELIPDFEVPKK
jgi:hypothetical protein